jgi:hypothetical protein
VPGCAPGPLGGGEDRYFEELMPPEAFDLVLDGDEDL